MDASLSGTTRKMRWGCSDVKCRYRELFSRMATVSEILLVRMREVKKDGMVVIHPFKVMKRTKPSLKVSE